MASPSPIPRRPHDDSPQTAIPLEEHHAYRGLLFGNHQITFIGTTKDYSSIIYSVSQDDKLHELKLKSANKNIIKEMGKIQLKKVVEVALNIIGSGIHQEINAKQQHQLQNVSYTHFNSKAVTLFNNDDQNEWPHETLVTDDLYKEFRNLVLGINEPPDEARAPHDDGRPDGADDRPDKVDRHSHRRRQGVSRADQRRSAKRVARHRFDDSDSESPRPSRRARPYPHPGPHSGPHGAPFGSYPVQFPYQPYFPPHSPPVHDQHPDGGAAIPGPVPAAVDERLPDDARIDLGLPADLLYNDGQRIRDLEGDVAYHQAMAGNYKQQLDEMSDALARILSGNQDLLVQRKVIIEDLQVSNKMLDQWEELFAHTSDERDRALETITQLKAQIRDLRGNAEENQAQIQDLIGQKNNLVLGARHLREECYAARIKIRQLEHESRGLLGILGGLQNTIGEQIDSIGELREQLNRLSQQMERESVSSGQQQTDAHQKMEGFSQKLNEALQVANAFRDLSAQQGAELQQSHALTSQQKKQLDQRERILAQSRRDVDSAKSELRDAVINHALRQATNINILNDHFRRREAELNAEKDSLTQQLAQLRIERDKLASQLEGMTQTEQKQRQDAQPDSTGNAQLTESLVEKQHVIQALRWKVLETEKLLDVKQRELDATTARIAVLDSHIETTENAKQAIEREAADLKERLVSLEAKLDALLEEHAGRKPSERDLKELQAIIDDLRQQLAAKNSKFDKLEGVEFNSAAFDFDSGPVAIAPTVPEQPQQPSQDQLERESWELINSLKQTIENLEWTLAAREEQDRKRGTADRPQASMSTQTDIGLMPQPSSDKNMQAITVGQDMSTETDPALMRQPSSDKDVQAMVVGRDMATETDFPVESESVGVQTEEFADEAEMEPEAAHENAVAEEELEDLQGQADALFQKDPEIDVGDEEDLNAAELARLHSQITALEAELKLAQAQTEEERDRLSAYQKEMEAQMEAARNVTAQALKEKSVAEAALLETNLRINALTRRLETIASDLDQKRDTISAVDLEKAKEVQAQTEKELSVLRAKVDSLEKQLAEIELELFEANKIITDLRRDLKKSQAKIVQIIEEDTAKQGELGNRIQQMLQQKTDDFRRISEAENKYSAEFTENTRLTDELAVERRKLAELSKQKDRLEGQLREKDEALEAQMQAHQQKLDELIQIHVGLNSQISKLKNQNGFLQQEIERLTAGIDSDKDSEKDKLKLTIRDLQQSNSDLLKLVAKREESSQQLQAMEEIFSRNLKGYSLTAETFEETLSNLPKLFEELARLRSQTIDDKELSALRTQISSLEQQLAERTLEDDKELSALRTQISSLEQQLTERTLELSEANRIERAQRMDLAHYREKLLEIIDAEKELDIWERRLGITEGTDAEKEGDGAGSAS